MLFFFFFFNDTATTEIYTLSLHDALPISRQLGAQHLDHVRLHDDLGLEVPARVEVQVLVRGARVAVRARVQRSEEHTSELQSRQYLVCRLLLEKKKKNNTISDYAHHLHSS